MPASSLVTALAESLWPIVGGSIIYSQDKWGMKRKSQQQRILELYVLHLGMHAHEVSCTKQDIKFLAYEPERSSTEFFLAVLHLGMEQNTTFL